MRVADEREEVLVPVGPRHGEAHLINVTGGGEGRVIFHTLTCVPGKHGMFSPQGGGEA